MKASPEFRTLPLRFKESLRGSLPLYPINPSFPITVDEARRDLARIAGDPRPLERPLLLVGGFLDPFIGAVAMRLRFGSLVDDRRIISVALGQCLSTRGCVRRIISAVERAGFAQGPDETDELDVVGFSMGGIMARYAAVFGKPRLRIARLFSISAPHCGAERADRFPLLHPLQKHLRSGSDLITRLNESPCSYPIYSYVRLGDRAVGAKNAAPPGTIAWWVTTPTLRSAHNGAHQDARLLSDIMRRLRGETPIGLSPAAQLPCEA